MNVMKTPIIILATVLIIGTGFYMWYQGVEEQEAIRAITSFEECAAAGYPIMESYPEQCRTPDGRNFTRDISNDEPGGIVANGCAVAGCSSQLCVSANEADEIVTTCEYRAEYACYREASCEPQSDGKCGWTQTTDLTQCLASPPAIDTELQVM